jgi:hypothetical protein
VEMKKYPKYRCEFCEAVIQLRFNPYEDKKKFERWRYPKCKKKKKAEKFE